MTNEADSGRTVRLQRRVGQVSSTGGEKTIRVVVETLVKHPIYGKFTRRRSKLAVHDESGQAGVGDMVEVVACRRLSKSKSWRLVKVLRKASLPELTEK